MMGQVLTLLVMTAAYPVGGVLYFRYAVAQALSPLLLVSRPACAACEQPP